MIGRKFVPRGTLDGRWNLILRACHRCNNAKSDLENDLSAITMQPDADGIYARDHEALVRDARRKGRNSISRRTRKPVAESIEKLRLAGRLGPGVSFTCTLVAPPQPDPKRVYALAHYQLAAFFYVVSYESVMPRRGGYWPGGFFPRSLALRGDWCNVLHRDFMRQTQEWHPRMIGHTSDRFFKIAVRRKPAKELWSWALEWNCNLRVIGFFGNQKVAASESRHLSRLKQSIVAQHDHGVFKGRAEMPLANNDDTMFDEFGVDWGESHDRRSTSA